MIHQKTRWLLNKSLPKTAMESRNTKINSESNKKVNVGKESKLKLNLNALQITELLLITGTNEFL